MADNLVVIKGFLVDFNLLSLDSYTVDEFRKALLTNQITVEQLEEWSKKTKSSLQEIAYSFLEKTQAIVLETEEIYKTAISLGNAIILLKAGSKDAAKNFVSIVKKDTETVDKLISLSTRAVLLNEEFEKELKNYLGRKAITTYTPYQNGTNVSGTAIYELDSLLHILHIGKEKQSSYLKKSELELLQLVIENKAHRVNIQEVWGSQPGDEEAVRHLENTYTAFIDRYNKYKYNHTPSHLVLMELDDLWGAIWLSNQGYIVEAYHRAVFQREKNFVGAIDPNIPEWDMLNFAYLIEEEDSTSSVLEDDIITFMESIAVKSGQASIGTLSLGIQVAKDILSETNQYKTEELFRQYLTRYAEKIRKNDNLLRHMVFYVAKDNLQNFLSLRSK